MSKSLGTLVSRAIKNGLGLNVRGRFCQKIKITQKKGRSAWLSGCVGVGEATPQAECLAMSSRSNRTA